MDLTLVDGTIVHAAAEFAPSKLSKPKKLGAVALAATEVSLRWNDRSGNEDSFEIQMQPPGRSFAIAAIVGADVEKITISGLTPGTTYRFRVRALASARKSGFSNKRRVSTAEKRRQAADLSRLTTNLRVEE